ncbi:MAG: MFS transporter, partial [Dehalococcoidia bacterium]
MMLGAVAGSTIGGQALSRWSHYKVLALAGGGLMTSGMVLLAFMDATSSNGEVTRNMVLVGVGLGVSFPVLTIVVQNAFPYTMMGLVTASVQFFRSTGGALGVAIMGAILASRLSANLESGLPKESVKALGPDKVAQLQDPNALVNPESLAHLQEQFAERGEEGAALLQSLLAAMKDALASSLHDVFVLSAVVVALAVVALFFLKEIPLRKAHAPPSAPS